MITRFLVDTLWFPCLLLPPKIFKHAWFSLRPYSLLPCLSARLRCLLLLPSAFSFDRASNVQDHDFSYVTPLPKSTLYFPGFSPFLYWFSFSNVIHSNRFLSILPWRFTITIWVMCLVLFTISIVIIIIKSYISIRGLNGFPRRCPLTLYSFVLSKFSTLRVAWISLFFFFFQCIQFQYNPYNSATDIHQPHFESHTSFSFCPLWPYEVVHFKHGF